MTVKYVKSIVCLANSRKTSGRCVAGKIVGGADSGQWLRPVSARPTGELSEEERRYENGKSPQLGDVIGIPLCSPQPHAFQPENHLIDDKYYWTLERRSDWDEIRRLADGVSGCLWDNDSSGYNGLNDRIDEREAANAVAQFGGSLKLIDVNDLKI